MNALRFAFVIHLTAATHSLQYFYSAVTPGLNIPEYTAVGLVDGEQFMHYDSNSKQSVPKTEWIERNVGTDYWHRSTQVQQNTQEIFRVGVAILIRRFNNTKGVHTWQVAYGCELDDDGNKTGYIRFGYDGEDYISLDMKTHTWTAADAKAVITKHKWEGTAKAVEHKAYLENTCIEWLQKYVSYGRDTLERKVPPEVSLFQKDSSSPVVCHTTGFFPRRMDISWMKNGEDLHEDVQLGETLPNQDGTFQKRSILTVSPEELDRNVYTCVVQHSGLEKELALHVDPGGGISSVGFIGVSVLLVPIGCMGFFIWRKKKNGFKAVAVQTQCNHSLMELDLKVKAAVEDVSAAPPSML